MLFHPYFLKHTNRPVRLKQDRPAKRKIQITPGKIFQVALAVVGFTLFGFLAREVDLSAIPQESFQTLPTFVLMILGLLVVNYTLDTASWWIVCGDKRPTLWQLILIRLRCEAITNVMPLGGFIGEPMKVSFLMGYSGMTRSEATTSFILSKFVLIVGQVFYIFAGLALSYTVVNQVADGAFNFGDIVVSDFAGYALLGAMIVLLLTLSLPAAMIWFEPMNKRLSFSEKNGRRHHWWNRILQELREIETLVASEFRRHRYRLIIALVFSFLAWSLNGVELYLIVRWLGIDASFVQVYSIDAVSVVVRMLVFVIPIGMGGQDLAILGLVSAHGFANPETTTAGMVVLKRTREFAVIGVGLLLLLLMPKPQAANSVVSESSVS